MELCSNGTDDDGDGLTDEVSAMNTDCNACSLEQFQGRAYWFCNTEESWPVARDACDALGVSLTSVHDMQHDEFLLSHLVVRGGALLYRRILDRSQRPCDGKDLRMGRRYALGLSGLAAGRTQRRRRRGLCCG